MKYFNYIILEEIDAKSLKKEKKKKVSAFFFSAYFKNSRCNKQCIDSES